MTPRSLFIIVIRLLTVFFIGTEITGFIQLFTSAFDQRFTGVAETVTILFGSLLSFGLVTLFAFVMLFRTGWLIDKLKLDKGFDQEEFSLKMDYGNLLRMSLLITGIYMLAENIPMLFSEIYQILRAAQYRVPNAPIFNKFIIIEVAKILAAYVLLTNSNYITNFVISRQKNKDSEL